MVDLLISQQALADLDQVAVRAADVGADFAAVIFWLSQKLGTFGRPFPVNLCDIGNAHVEESAGMFGVGRRDRGDPGLVVGRAAAGVEN